jgi:hypothetical protein
MHADYIVRNAKKSLARAVFQAGALAPNDRVKKALLARLGASYVNHKTQVELGCDAAYLKIFTDGNEVKKVEVFYGFND